MKTGWIALLLGGALASGVAAQTQPAPPAAPAADPNSKLINVPGTPWTIYGAGQTNTYADKGGPKDYPVTHVVVSAAGKNAWDIGAVMPLAKPIAAGDVVFVAVYLRAPDLKDGETTPLPMIGVTGAAPPYAAIATGSAQISNQWKQYFAVGKAPSAMPVGGAQVGIHLGNERHVIDLGPIRVFDLGPNADVTRLPHN